MEEYRKLRSNGRLSCLAQHAQGVERFFRRGREASAKKQDCRPPHELYPTSPYFCMLGTLCSYELQVLSPGAVTTARSVLPGFHGGGLMFTRYLEKRPPVVDEKQAAQPPCAASPSSRFSPAEQMAARLSRDSGRISPAEHCAPIVTDLEDESNASGSDHIPTLDVTHSEVQKLHRVRSAMLFQGIALDGAEPSDMEPGQVVSIFSDPETSEDAGDTIGGLRSPPGSKSRHQSTQRRQPPRPMITSPSGMKTLSFTKTGSNLSLGRTGSGSSTASANANEKPQPTPSLRSLLTSPSKVLAPSRSFLPSTPSSLKTPLAALKRSLSSLSVRGSKKRPVFSGHWECTSTWGMDEFLKGCGISKFQRIAALNAPWPSWEFEQSSDRIVFINHSMMGDIREEFQVDGPAYIAVDGRKQRLTCKSWWEGERLVIERSGPQGRFREERRIDAEGNLQFELTGLEQGQTGSWGRTFRRK